MFIGGLDLRLRPYGAAAPAGPFGGHATLTDGLVSYWALDEESGVRVDSVDSNDLTDNNTVGFANLGPDSVVADFVPASTDSLSASVDFNLTNKLTVAYWIYPDSVVAEQAVVTKWQHGTATEWAFETNSGQPKAFIAPDPNNGGTVTGVGTAVLTSQWHSVVWIFDGAGATDADRLKCFVDGVANTLTFTGTIPASLQDTAAQFSVGSFTGTLTRYFDGRIAQIGVWNVALSDAAFFYNGGIGKTYSELSAAEKVGLISYWNLSEAAGSRADSHGSNNLTDNSTVGSVDNSHPDFPVGKAASFVAANSESLTKTDFASLTEWTISIWAFVQTGDPAGRYIITRVDGWPNSVNLAVYGPNTGNIWALVGNGATFVNAVQAPTADSWNHIVAWYDTADNKVRISINGAAAAASGALAGSLYSNDTRLEIGNNAFSPGFWNNKIAQAGMWNRVLTAQERSDLYNSGNGLFYGS